jgi:hypothetical protein
MAPVTRTPEYLLLDKLAQDKQPRLSLNGIALRKALDDGYAMSLGLYVFITQDGIDRLEHLQDR